MKTRPAVTFALAVSALAAVLAGSAPAERPRALVQGALGRRLDEVLRRYHEYGLSGTVLVAKDGSVVLHEGFGFHLPPARERLGCFLHHLRHRRRQHPLLKPNDLVFQVSLRHSSVVYSF